MDQLKSPVGSTDWPLPPVLLLLGLAWVVLGWPWLSGRVTIPWDAKAHFLPQIQFLAQSLASGQSPFWAPYVFSGHPQIADPQSMIFSPPFLALAMIDGNPGLHAVDVTLLVMVLIGAGSLVLWFRDRGWHWIGAMLAGLAFGFGAAMAWRIQHIGQVLSLVYLALTLLLLTRALERTSATYGLAAGVAGGLMLLGRDQVALLGAYLLVAHVVWWVVGKVSDGKVSDLGSDTLPPLLAGALGGVLIVAIPLLLTALVTGQSNRPAIDLEGAGRGSLHPALLLTLLMPDLFGAGGRMEDYWGPPSFAWRDTGLFIAQNVGILYVGAVPALLVLLGCVTGRLWHREIRFFSIATVAMLAYALGWYTPAFGVLHAIVPGVDLFRRPADAVFPIGLLLAILAGYMAHRLLTDAASNARRADLLAVAGILLIASAGALVLGLRLERLPRTLSPLLTAAVCFTVGAAALAVALRLASIRPIAAGLLLVGVAVGDLAWNNGPTTSSAMPPAYYDVLDPRSGNETISLLKRKVAETRSDTRRDRVELLGLGFHWPNASLTHGLENTLGYNPLRLGLYSQATGAEDHVGLPDQRKFSPLFPSFRSPLADLLGLRFIASGAPIESVDKRLSPGDLVPIARTAEATIYENPRALPRVLFTTRAEGADFAALLANGHWPTVDLPTTVLLETPPPSASGARRPGRVRIASYRNTEVVIEASSPDGGFVVLNDIWHPWWVASIDGQPAELVRANVIFRAVAVPPGDHVVRFAFRPLAGLRDTLLRRR